MARLEILTGPDAGKASTYRPSSRLDYVADLVTAHPYVFLIASLLFTALCCAYLPSVKVAHNVDAAMEVANDPEVAFYDKFKEVFHNEEFFVIAFEKEDIFTKENLMLIKDITDKLKNTEEVKDVKSITNVDDAVGSHNTFIVKKFIDKVPEKNRK
jgi:predicted RND superfamily exporter protein